MIRGLILGSIAFGAAFAFERQFVHVGRDLARYNKLSEMSGDPPFMQKQLKEIVAWITRPGAGMLQTLQHDALRYARMKSM
jgi:hypothetical protein